MMFSASGQLYEICSLAAGIAGNLFAFVLFVSPMQMLRRIISRRSTEQFSGMPFVYSLLNCLICSFYGLPFVSRGVMLVTTVNSIGALFQLVYLIIFIVYADTKLKLKMSGLLIAVFVAFAAIAFSSLKFFDHDMRQLLVGYLSIASLISMFASPLSIIKLVIRTKSVEFMPFSLSLATFLMSISFFAYGLILEDFFIYIPNGVGSILGIVQLLLYAYFNKSLRGDPRVPLLG